MIPLYLIVNPKDCVIDKRADVGKEDDNNCRTDKQDHW